MGKTKNIIEKKCIICKRPFLVRDKIKNGRCSYSIRQKSSKTCSRICSKNWLRFKEKNKKLTAEQATRLMTSLN